MAIDLTLRSAKGTPLTHSELDGNFTNLKNGIINSTRVVNGIKGLVTDPSVIQTTKGFYTDSNSGGGQFYYDPSVSKADHNGGTVIAPEAIAAWNGTVADLNTLLNWSGAGFGCYVRVFDISKGVNTSYFGMVTSKSGNSIGTIPDATAPMTAAIEYCNSLYEEITSVGYFGATNIKLKLPKGFSKTSSPLPFLRGFDLESEGTTHFQCSTNKGHAFIDCGEGKLLDFVVTGIKLQQYTTCYRAKSDDSDMTQWTFIRCGFRNVDLGIDTVSFAESRSSILTLQNCKVSYGVTRLANSYCDMTHVIGGWYSHNMNSALIVFSGRLCVSGGIYVPVLPEIQNQFCWYQGELADRSAGGSFTGCRFGAEFGGGVVLYIKSNDGEPDGNGLSTGNTQAFKFSGCQLSANNIFDPLNTGVTVRGVVVFNKFNNGGVSFDTSTISTDLGPAYAGVDLSRVIVDYNNVAATEAPNNFSIEFDESTWRSANNGANRPAGNNLLQYIGNGKSRSIFKGTSACGNLIVGLTSDSQKNKATFSLKLGAVPTNYGFPILFDLDLGQLGSSSNNAYRNSRFAGYKCSIVGGRDLTLAMNIYKINKTLLYSHLGANGMNVNSEIVSMHFGTGDTGTDYVDAALLEPDGTVNVTIVWGQLAESPHTGLAKITPSFDQYSRLLNGNNL